MRHEIGHIISPVIDIVAVPRLARSPMPAAIVRDTAKSLSGEKVHLIVPGVRGERPAMTEDDRLPCAPVLVIDLGSVSRRKCAHGSCASLSSYRGARQPLAELRVCVH